MTELVAVLVLCAVLAGLVWVARLALRARPTARVRDDPPDASWLKRPSPGEIWWADVPFDDAPASKVRPCLVLRTHARGAHVLRLSSQYKARRPGWIEVDTTAWDRRATHNSWLDLSRHYELDDAAFRRKAGRCEPVAWRSARSRHATGWVH